MWITDWTRSRYRRNCIRSFDIGRESRHIHVQRASERITRTPFCFLGLGKGLQRKDWNYASHVWPQKYRCGREILHVQRYAWLLWRFVQASRWIYLRLVQKPKRRIWCNERKNRTTWEGGCSQFGNQTLSRQIAPMWDWQSLQRRDQLHRPQDLQNDSRKSSPSVYTDHYWVSISHLPMLPGASERRHGILSEWNVSLAPYSSKW